MAFLAYGRRVWDARMPQATFKGQNATNGVRPSFLRDTSMFEGSSERIKKPKTYKR
jgi:hypothetical protein